MQEHARTASKNKVRWSECKELVLTLKDDEALIVPHKDYLKHYKSYDSFQSVVRKWRADAKIMNADDGAYIVIGSWE